MGEFWPVSVLHRSVLKTVAEKIPVWPGRTDSLVEDRGTRTECECIPSRPSEMSRHVT